MKYLVARLYRVSVMVEAPDATSAIRRAQLPLPFVYRGVTTEHVETHASPVGKKTRS